MTDHRIRSGSLQVWPRKRANKILPSVNWKQVPTEKEGLLGFIGYKVGMVSIFAKDNTEESMTKGKKIAIPSTILECPSMKIFSVRLYKDGKVAKDIVVSNEKELKRKVKVMKEVKKIDEELKDFEFDDLRVLVYSEVKLTSIKKSPDMIELGLSGSKEEKLAFVKERIGKSISISEVFSEGLVDVRGVTKGFGFNGPVKRFGISLKASKSEKGRRRPGSIGPWHPSRVTFRVPMAGQTGFHTRLSYNSLILEIGKISEKDINVDGGFHKYGKLKTEYIILRGSIPGPKKRVLLLTQAMRPTRKQSKKKFDVLEIR
jgi:large subunit ribosomal protein L3